MLGLRLGPGKGQVGSGGGTGEVEVRLEGWREQQHQPMGDLGVCSSLDWTAGRAPFCLLLVTIPGIQPSHDAIEAITWGGLFGCFLGRRY